MKIAVGLIGIFLSLLMLMQSCTIYGLSGFAESEDIAGSSAIGMFAALLMFCGGAFAFGLPRTSVYFFASAAILSSLGGAAFPDMVIWAIVCTIFTIVLTLYNRKEKKASSRQNIES